uniref:Transferrin receptor subunit ESAG6 n=4 Tax=Trypanosoma brucei TaxID=5691 RepID=ESAG6_TRYBB|nr:RecName: Full=Transferrin receptor subunit ESAG6; AltName: Full=Expression site associated gene 6; Flags: Precursor [Trypanosoma brucei brucei]6SOY_A Chain A, ESAG6, subunit of heterodimeric transferrin receptor [Trypanosoma brucei]6SOZ_A Chain A, ESAG6, subunit of heterodimeric transferrin receptor [Trypanosoma brucei]CAD21457.1 ESAG6, subunit of heterodimeric transferrin receptor [Trypanosoma brucei]CAQ57468.1 expression site-associated gene 6 (ESAG6) protein [Trypanosoma brucei brucei]CA
MRFWFVLLALLGKEIYAYENERNALNATAANKVCGLSTYLKGIAHRVNSESAVVTEKLSDLKMRSIQLQLSVMRNRVPSGEQDCKDIRTLLKTVLRNEFTFQQELEEMRNASALAAAAAGLAAGRLEEWIFVFAQAAGRSSQFCISVGKTGPAEYNNLQECFDGTIGPETLYKIEDSRVKESAKTSLQLHEVLSSISFGSLGVKNIRGGNGKDGCNLVRTDTDGVLEGGSPTRHNLTWGGGVMNFGSYQNGSMYVEGGEYGDATEYGAVRWTEDPSKVSIFKDVIRLFARFQEAKNAVVKKIKTTVDELTKCIGQKEAELTNDQLYEEFIWETINRLELSKRVSEQSAFGEEEETIVKFNYTAEPVRGPFTVAGANAAAIHLSVSTAALCRSALLLGVL